MTETRTPDLDMRLSPASVQSLEKYLEVLQASRQEALALQKVLKQIEKNAPQNAVSRMVQGSRNERTATTRVLDGYAQGRATQQRTRIEQVTRAGSSAGQEAQALQTMLKYAREYEKSLATAADRSRAAGMNMRETARQLQNMTDLTEVKRVRELAILRVGQAQLANNSRSAKTAADLATQANQRLQTLKEEEQVQKKLQATERERVKALLASQKADQLRLAIGVRERKASPAHLAQQNAEARRKQNDRLFGDGGANLMQVQAGLMGNYMLLSGAMNGARSMARFLVDFDDSMHNLQATVRVTDGQIDGLRSTILDTAEQTKFFATELADAAVNMGQAGMSAREIEESLKGVALLATATGTDIASSVDVMTSVIGVFDKTARQTEDISNTITQAVNDSKLSIDKLTLGLQYAGNTAAQSGVSFEELIAAMGAISNAGIRSGSTIGTGLRQLLVSFQKPSKAFRAELSALGLTMDDVNLRVHGLSGVMENLHNAGFDAQDAIRSFEVRAAAAFNALNGQIGTMQSLQKAFIDSNAAILANDTQMRSLANRGRQLGSALQTMATTALTPVVTALADLALTATNAAQGMSPLLGVLTSFGVALAGVAATGRVLKLIAGFGAASAGAAAPTTLLARSVTSLGVASKFLMGPWGLVISTAVAAGVALYGMADRTSRLSEALDKARTKLAESSGDMTSLGQELDNVGDRMNSLKERASALKGVKLQMEARQLRQDFANMGLEIPKTVSNVDQLIEALGKLRQEMSQEYLLKVRQVISDTQNLADAEHDKILSSKEVINAHATKFMTELSATGKDYAYGGGEEGRKFRKRAEETVSLVRKSADSPEDTDLRRTAQKSAQELAADLRTAGKSGAVPEEYSKGLQKLLEEHLQKPLASLAEAQNEHTKALEGVKAGEIAAAAEEALPRSAPLRDEARAFAQQGEDTFRPLDLNSSNLDGVAAEFQMLKNMSETQETLLRAQMEQVRQRANSKLSGAGDEAVKSLETDLSTGAASRETEAQAILGSMGKLFENNLKDFDTRTADEEKSISNKIKGIDPERDREAYLKAQGEMKSFLERSAEEKNKLLMDEANFWQSVGDSDKAKEARQKANTGRLQSQGELIDLQTSSDSEARKYRMDQADKLVSNAKGYTQDQVGRRQTAINSLTDPKQQLAAQQVLRDYILSRSQVEQDLVQSSIDQIKQDGTPEQLATAHKELADLLASRQDSLNQLDQDILETKDKIRGKAVADANNSAEDKQAGLKTEITDLETKLSAAGDNDIDARIEILRQIGEKQQEIAAARVSALDEIITLNTGVDTEEAQRAVQDAQNEKGQVQAEAKGSLQETADRIDGENIKRHEQNIEKAQSALDGLKALLQTTLSEQERSAYEGRAWDLLNTITGEEDAKAALEKLNSTQLETLHEGQNERSTGLRTFIQREQKDNGGTGSKGSKGHKSAWEKKSENEKWIESQSSLVSAYSDMSERNLVSASSAGQVISQAKDGARSRLTSVDSQLRDLYGKERSQGLTSKEQEKVTQLLKEQEGLLGIIQGQYAKIGAQMILQGDTAEGVKLVMQEWASSSLDLNQALSEGLLGTLNTAETGLTDVFTSVSQGTSGVIDAFRNMGVNVLKSINQMIAQMIAMKTIMGLIGWADPTNSWGLLPTTGKRMGGLTRQQSMGVQQGSIRRFALGGSPNRDSQLTLTQPGEYVLRKSAVDVIGVDTLNQLNAAGNSVVSKSSGQEAASPQGQLTHINFYLVDERSQIGGLSARDVVAVVTDDLAKGGTTKKLVKAIQLGNM